MTPSTSVYAAPLFWERLWRSAGIQSVGLFIIGYVIYGYRPHVGASADALVAFYDADRARILIAAVFFGMALRTGRRLFPPRVAHHRRGVGASRGAPDPQPCCTKWLVRTMPARDHA